MLRHLLLLPLALFLTTACSGDDEDAQVLGVSVESSSTTSSISTSTTRAPTSSTTAAPPTTAATTTAPAPPPPSTTTTTAPRPTTTAPVPTTAPPTTAPPTTVATRQIVSGRYVSPDGDGIIEVELMTAAGNVVASQITGPSGGDFSFAVAPGTYRLQITDAGPGPSANRTSGQVITRTDSFTLEAGRSARFECHVRTGCTGGVR